MIEEIIAFTKIISQMPVSKEFMYKFVQLLPLDAINELESEDLCKLYVTIFNKSNLILEFADEDQMKIIKIKA
jgi:hypothetical protein